MTLRIKKRANLDDDFEFAARYEYGEFVGESTDMFHIDAMDKQLGGLPDEEVADSLSGPYTRVYVFDDEGTLYEVDMSKIDDS